MAARDTQTIDCPSIQAAIFVLEHGVDCRSGSMKKLRMSVVPSRYSWPPFPTVSCPSLASGDMSLLLAISSSARTLVAHFLSSNNGTSSEYLCMDV
ncbi:hypothetical protein J3458_001876 [Metarhizium acridum]|uniref:uncharacterized protein n=1 Tax=Metarhizium acridum TaxID=92637 RepID=UPI001C6B7302|nr:hypothetical protein J3458_001876 [Metarhizium acridum]